MSNLVEKTSFSEDAAITKDRQSGVGTLTSGEGVVAQYTLVALVSGKWVVYVAATHSDHKLAITKNEEDATSSDIATSMLFEGEIRGASVTAGDGAVTDAAVIERCMKSGIYFI